MDPISFIQPTLYGCSHLSLHFQLSLPEIHSAQIASTYVPNVKYCFGIGREVSEHRGVQFGRMLLLIATTVKNSLRNTKQERQFAARKVPKIPSKEQSTRSSSTKSTFASKCGRTRLSYRFRCIPRSTMMYTLAFKICSVTLDPSSPSIP
jgi:hypothetical protein